MHHPPATKQVNRLSRLMIIACVVFAALAVTLYAWLLLRPAARPGVANLTHDWPTVRYTQTGGIISLQLQRTLGDEITGAMLLIESNHQWVQLALDGEVLYDTAAEQGQNPGLDLHLPHLPAGYGGKTLTLTLSTPYPQYAGQINRVYLGTALSLTEQWLKIDAFPLMLALFSTALGLAVTGISFTMAVRKRAGPIAPSGVLIGVYALFWGIYTAAGSLCFLLLVPPLWASHITLILYTLWPFFLTSYLYCRFERYKKWMFPVLVLQGLSALSCLAYALFSPWGMTPMLGIINLVHAVAVAAVVVLGVLEYRAGNSFLHFLLPWIFLATISGLFSLIRFYIFQDYAMNWLYLLSFFGLLVAMCVYNLYQMYTQWLADRDEARTLKLKDWAIAGSYAAVQQRDEEIRKMRHEVSHQLAGVQVLLGDGDIEKARAYLGTFIQENDRDDVFTQNSFVNVILSDIDARAQKQNTRITIEARLPPVLPVPENDFCGILMNLADNALEACRRAPLGEKQEIHLRIHIRTPYLLVYCQNTHAGAVRVRDGRFLTSKPTASHGYGLRVVRDLTERNSGLLDIDYNATHFTVSAALRLSGLRADDNFTGQLSQ